MDQGLFLEQKLILTPQLIQSMEVLQMDAQELTEYINGQLLENPVLESEEPPARSLGLDGLASRLAWLDAANSARRHRAAADTGGAPEPEDFACDPEPLSAELGFQLERMRPDSGLREAARLIIAMLDERGYLTEDVQELARLWGLEPGAVQKALELVQSMEPAGVGARDLSECLCLQLLRRGAGATALQIAQSCLEELARGHEAAIARKLKAGRQEVAAACELIRGLEPNPGRAYQSFSRPQYILPDLTAAFENGEPVVSINEEGEPRLYLSEYYSRLYRDSDDRELREYLSAKLNQAKWLMRCVSQRRSTLLACAQAIARRQREFFRRGPDRLEPMTLAAIADDTGLHESTVSRAIRGKHIQTDFGVFALSALFTRGLGSEAAGSLTSPATAKALLRELVDAEDKKRPLSDRRLCELMASRGVELSRRTAAKYRDELGIAPAFGRTHE